MRSSFFLFRILTREFFFIFTNYPGGKNFKNPLFRFLFLLFFGITTNLESLPISHITSKENFQRIQITKKAYYTQVPTSDIFELIRLEEDASSIRFLIPIHIFHRWSNSNIQYRLLPFPNQFSEIDPSFKPRLRKGCIPLKFMLNGYKTSSLNQLYLHCIEKEFPHIVKRFHLGRSIENRKITALRIRIPKVKIQNKTEKDNHSIEERDPVLFHCGIHGNEMIAIEHCYDIIQQIILQSDDYPSLEEKEIWVIPVVNPDGLDSHWFRTIHTGRTNSRNVDLNRNFPFLWNSGIDQASSGNPKSPYFRGYKAGSEPEVQALLNLFETKRFTFSMSIHCYANSILIPYSIPDTLNPKPNHLQRMGEKLIEDVNSQREDKPFLAKKNLYPVDGTDQDTFYHHYGTYAYLLETSHMVENYLYVPFILQDIRPAWKNLLKIQSNSYKWKIQVLDENNNPIIASIHSSAYQYFHEEIRMTNKYGKYLEIAPNSNDIKVTISADGFQTKTIEISPIKRIKTRIVILKKK